MIKDFDFKELVDIFNHSTSNRRLPDDNVFIAKIDEFYYENIEKMEKMSFEYYDDDLYSYHCFIENFLKYLNEFSLGIESINTTYKYTLDLYNNNIFDKFPYFPSIEMFKFMEKNLRKNTPIF